jgi:hypothetical protein
MAYWILALVITVFGFISGFSIGLPVLLVGITMLALGPFRARPLVFWPVLLAVLAADATFMAIAPFQCIGTASLGEVSIPSDTVCTSLIGLRYEGEGLFNPSLMPAVLVGLVVGILVGVVTFVVLSRRAQAERQPGA